jgi:tRNA pseudouridine38-40 synthase
MNYYRLTLQYAGTHYFGFQYQKDIPTIQSELNTSISKVIGENFSTMAASRTDTGVHAIEQIVKISTINPIDTETFINDCNKNLPTFIRCLEIKTSSWDFKPAVQSKTKEYHYLFTNQKNVLKEDQLYISNISNTLNFNNINICISSLIGLHDFCNFYSSGSNVKSSTRHIFECELKMINPHDFFPSNSLFEIPNHIQNCFELKIIGNGFLKQMIRHIVSALWMVGSGKITVDDFIHLLNGPKSIKQNWKVAPPNGLYLYKINY